VVPAELSSAMGLLASAFSTRDDEEPSARAAELSTRPATP